VLRDAIRIATKHGLVKSLAEARVTYAAILADLGRINAALSECDAAALVLRGNDAGPLLAQRALILSRAGRNEEALADYGKALPLLRATRDIHFQALAYMNRANVLTYLGRISAAEEDLRTGMALAQSHEMREVLAMLAGNLGFVMTRKGNIPLALRQFEDALQGPKGYMLFTTVLDRAEALLSVGLANEARESLEAMIGDVAEAGFAVDIAECHLMLAHAALAEGDPEAAFSFARKAFGEFNKQGRPRWALLARQLEIRARWANGERGAKLATAARDAHAKLATAGWQVAALHCLLVAGRV
jgi:tetratricopeptide (TPR) repeat protein